MRGDCILKTQNRLVILKTYNQSIKNDSDVTNSHNQLRSKGNFFIIRHIFDLKISSSPKCNTTYALNSLVIYNVIISHHLVNYNFFTWDWAKVDSQFSHGIHTRIHTLIETWLYNINRYELLGAFNLFRLNLLNKYISLTINSDIDRISFKIKAIVAMWRNFGNYF